MSRFEAGLRIKEHNRSTVMVRKTHTLLINKTEKEADGIV